MKLSFCRFAVLAGPSIPIIGEGDKLPNDRYLILSYLNRVRLSFIWMK